MIGTRKQLCHCTLNQQSIPPHKVYECTSCFHR
uniref:Uncharacterized protein n=1 Tax=Anguilla anguilla TaxID=7936 RepID=A0A0E9UPF8_ANGAN